MECKKCPYFEPKKEIAAGRVLVGFCKLRNKYMSDTTKGKEQCKDRAVVDLPADARPVAIKSEPSLFTEKEKVLVERAMHRPVERSSASPTLAELAAKQMQARPEPAAAPVRPRKPTLGVAPKAKPAPAEVRKPAPQQKPAQPQQKHVQQPDSLPHRPKAGLSASPETSVSAAPRSSPPQIVPPLKMTPEEAIKLLDQQLSGKINAKFSKGGNEARTDAEKEIIRRAVWGGGT